MATKTAAPRRSAGRGATDRTADVRERILTAALDLLRDGGIRALTQVKVARRAGVRQSHLTYYFATRNDLLSAVTERAVDGLASRLHRSIAIRPNSGRGLQLDQLAKRLSDPAHMRMFVGMIVQADADPAVRRLLRRGTERMEAAVAEMLGPGAAADQARLVLAALWGLGLYRFAIRPAPGSDPTGAYVAWIVRASKRSST